MATHRLFCGHEDCGEPFESVDNDRPRLCPKCDRLQRWTETPPYKLTKQDERFLHSLRIQAVEPEVDDGA